MEGEPGRIVLAIGVVIGALVISTVVAPLLIGTSDFTIWSALIGSIFAIFGSLYAGSPVGMSLWISQRIRDILLFAPRYFVEVYGNVKDYQGSGFEFKSSGGGSYRRTDTLKMAKKNPAMYLGMIIGLAFTGLNIFALALGLDLTNVLALFISLFFVTSLWLGPLVMENKPGRPTAQWKNLPVGVIGKVAGFMAGAGFSYCLYNIMRGTSTAWVFMPASLAWITMPLVIAFIFFLPATIILLNLVRGKYHRGVYFDRRKEEKGRKDETINLLKEITARKNSLAQNTTLSQAEKAELQEELEVYEKELQKELAVAVEAYDQEDAKLTRATRARDKDANALVSSGINRIETKIAINIASAPAQRFIWEMRNYFVIAVFGFIWFALVPVPDSVILILSKGLALEIPFSSGNSKSR